MAYDNSNSGSIWRNEKKTEPNHPDYSSPYKTPFQITCPHCRQTVFFSLGAWVKDWKDKTTEAVKKFFSCKLQPCNPDGTKFTPAASAPPQQAAAPEEGVPF